MVKILLSMLFLVAGCSDKDSSKHEPLLYSYGAELLVQLPDLDASYVPKDLDPKIISENGFHYVPMDFISQELILNFDASAGTASGQTVIKFKVHNHGLPYFELQALPVSIFLDGVPAASTTVTDPHLQGQVYQAINSEVFPGNIYEVRFDYVLPSGRVTFTDGGVRFLTDMTDLNGKFFEYWGPAGFEGDSFQLDLILKTQNSTSAHDLYTNGNSSVLSPNEWKISFPDYFTTSSFYVHFTNNLSLIKRTFTYQGLENSIPVEVYGITESTIELAVTELPKLFKELEEDYGPYPHAKFLAYMNNRGGGMEYAGATITSFGSLDHELLHSWFARSIIPADGRSGWLDEATASWRDNGYFRPLSILQRNPTNLSNFSPFMKVTPRNSYADGRMLLSELDYVLAPFGGMKNVLKGYFSRYKNRAVTNEEFWNFLQLSTMMDLSPFYQRYTMGHVDSEESLDDELDSNHPAPLTEEEILILR